MPNPAAIGPNASPHSDRVGYCKVRAFGIGRTLFPPPHDRDVWKPLAVVAVAAVASACYTLDSLHHLQATRESASAITPAGQRSELLSYDTKRHCRSLASCRTHRLMDDSFQIVLSK